MTSRTCAECSREFAPSSRHLRCPACRSRDRCPCGKPKQGHSTTCADCRDEGGAANGNWRGGRTRHKAGYVMVLARWHPRAGSNGYVFEHVLVMEDVLGRLLLPGETVHHLNGQRDDNRAGNLELWTRPQPSGIRAADAVAWARQVLARYGELLSRGHGESPRPVAEGSCRQGASSRSEDEEDVTAVLIRSWRRRESNPGAPVPGQGFSGRSWLCFSRPSRSHQHAGNGLSRSSSPRSPAAQEPGVPPSGARSWAGGSPRLTATR